jgi:uroporphyrinogen-III synthase
MATEVSSPDVILLRSADDPDPYVQAFSAVGFHAICRPVLRFSFPSDQALAERLRRPDAYGGIVATSPRVGRALQRIFDDEGTTHAEWEGAPAYAVGPKTAAELRALSFEVRGEDTGTAAALAAAIAADVPPAPLLFLCGDRRRDTLPTRLAEEEIAFEELVVYETHSRTDLTLPPPDDDTWLAFFSPSGLEAVQHAEADGSLRDYHRAAIGPTTAEALSDAGLAPEAVASSPSPDGLVNAILGAKEELRGA